MTAHVQAICQKNQLRSQSRFFAVSAYPYGFLPRYWY